jgi:hypothetical protein
LKKEIKKEYRRWKELPWSWIGRLRMAKTAIIPKAIYMFNTIPIKIPVTFITETKNSTLNFICKHKWPRTAKGILRKMSNARGMTILSSNYSAEP